MKGELVRDGGLLIERAGHLSRLDCPFAALGPDREIARCGDWCPHFGEPIEVSRVTNPAASVLVDVLLTCGSGRKFRFNQFKDGRVKVGQADGVSGESADPGRRPVS